MFTTNEVRVRKGLEVIRVWYFNSGAELISNGRMTPKEPLSSLFSPAQTSVSDVGVNNCYNSFYLLST